MNLLGANIVMHHVEPRMTAESGRRVSRKGFHDKHTIPKLAANLMDVADSGITPTHQSVRSDNIAIGPLVAKWPTIDNHPAAHLHMGRNVDQKRRIAKLIGVVSNGALAIIVHGIVVDQGEIRNRRIGLVIEVHPPIGIVDVAAVVPVAISYQNSTIGYAGQK